MAIDNPTIPPLILIAFSAVASLILNSLIKNCFNSFLGGFVSLITVSLEIIVGSNSICLNTADHNLIKASETARTLLSGKRYTKVALINKLTKNLDLTKDTLYILQQMASQSLESSKNEAQAKKWQDILTSTYKAERQIDKKNNLRLTLTSLMLHL